MLINPIIPNDASGLFFFANLAGRPITDDPKYLQSPSLTSVDRLVQLRTHSNKLEIAIMSFILSVLRLTFLIFIRMVFKIEFPQLYHRKLHRFSQMNLYRKKKVIASSLWSNRTRWQHNKCLCEASFYVLINFVLPKNRFQAPVNTLVSKK